MKNEEIMTGRRNGGRGGKSENRNPKLPLPEPNHWQKNGGEKMVPVGRRSCGASSKPERRQFCRLVRADRDHANKNVGAPVLPVSDFCFRFSDFLRTSDFGFRIFRPPDFLIS
jgi:hypothetical protein